jgi:hypothetical protein
MADYYSILKKTISGLANNTPQMREAVYTKARTAIEKQLRSIEPAPSDAAIEAQLQSLEEAILVLDSEYSAPAIPESMAAPVKAPEPPVAPTPPPVPEAPSMPPPTAPVAEPAAHIPPEPAPPPRAEAPVVPTPEAAPEIKTEEPPTVGIAPPPKSSVPQGALAGDVEPADGFDSYAEPKKKSGFFGKLVTAVLTLGILGGAGYGLWINRDSLQPMIASVLGGSETAQDTTQETPVVDTASETEQAINDDTAAQAEKESVKLGEDGQDTEVEAPVAPEEPLATLESEETPLAIDTGSEPETNEVRQAEDTVAEPVEEVGNEDEQQAAAQPEEQALPIGEVAYLYEEGSAGTGASRSNAAIAWDTRMESISEGLLPEPVIIGTMEVPEKNLSLNIEIKRNVDEALSASHIIEIRFDLPEGFSGGSIDNIARFVMKASEEARGEPLVAVPVKVSDGFFLIALDNLQQAVDFNTQLMLNSAWIDIPVSYGTGKRALVTIEKGGTGERVFQDAIKDWQNR